MESRHAEQRTTVRPQRPMVPPALRWAVSRLGLVAPGATARFAQKLFFTPIHAKVREGERRVLQNGQRHEIHSRGRRIVYFAWGDGPVVLLTHGWGGHAGQMTGFVEPLLRAGFRVVAVDQPAHGGSSGRRSSLVHFAETIEDVAAAVGGLDAAIAHSLGTSGVTLALSRGLPLKRAVFLAPSASFDGIWLRFREGVGVSPRVWSLMVRRTERWLGVGLDDIVPRSLAPRMRVPLLILHDPGDREIAFSDGEALVAAWPGARLQAVDAGGHVRMLKDPSCVAQAVAFLGSERQGGAEINASRGGREELTVEA